MCGHTRLGDEKDGGRAYNTATAAREDEMHPAIYRATRALVAGCFKNFNDELKVGGHRLLKKKKVPTDEP